MSDSGQEEAPTLTLCRSTRGQVRIVHPCQTDLPAEASNGTPLGYNPVQHLAIALGCCMTEFACRFLEHRNLPQTLMATLDWQVDGGRCRITRMDITLRMLAIISEEDRCVLGRMMNHCPVHQALDGNVPVQIRVMELDEAERAVAEGT